MSEVRFADTMSWLRLFKYYDRSFGITNCVERHGLAQPRGITIQLFFLPRPSWEQDPSWTLFSETGGDDEDDRTPHEVMLKRASHLYRLDLRYSESQKNDGNLSGVTVALQKIAKSELRYCDGV